jgi:WD40 repeat protein
MRINDLDDREVGVFLSQASPACGVTELPDGRVASVAYDGMLRIWDLADGSRSAKPILIKTGSRLVAALPDGRLIADGPKHVLRITVLPPRAG